MAGSRVWSICSSGGHISAWNSKAPFLDELAYRWSSPDTPRAAPSWVSSWIMGNGMQPKRPFGSAAERWSPSAMDQSCAQRIDAVIGLIKDVNGLGIVEVFQIFLHGIILACFALGSARLNVNNIIDIAGEAWCLNPPCINHAKIEGGMIVDRSAWLSFILIVELDLLQTTLESASSLRKQASAPRDRGSWPAWDCRCRRPWRSGFLVSIQAEANLQGFALEPVRPCEGDVR